MMETRKTYVFLSIVCLLIGSMIYVCFRTDTLLMFHWAQIFGLGDDIHTLRDNARPLRHLMPAWANNSLPYAMWVVSCMLAQLAIWHKSKAIYRYLWILAAPVLAIASELAQALRVIPGTFDWVDLILLALGAIVGAVACFSYSRSSYVKR